MIGEVMNWPEAAVAIVTALLPLLWALVEGRKRRQMTRERDALQEAIDEDGRAVLRANAAAKVKATRKLKKKPV